MRSDRALHAGQVGGIDLSGFFAQALLAGRGYLIGHRLVAHAIDYYVRLGGIETFRIAGERHDLDAIEVAVGAVVADDDR